MKRGELRWYKFPRPDKRRPILIPGMRRAPPHQTLHVRGTGEKNERGCLFG